MRRTSAHCLFVISALVALTGAGCASQRSTSDEPPSDQTDARIQATDTETPATTHHDDTAVQAVQAARPNPVRADEQTADSPLNDGNEAAALNEPEPCIDPIEDAASWLDRSHKRVFTSVCSTVAWFDGFFGDEHYDSASRQTFGRIGFSGFWDQRDGFDPRVRFRAKLALPALSERANVMVGRGDQKEFVEEKRTPSNSIPSNFDRVEDDSFLIGLGYQKDKGLKRGYSFSVGVKLHAPPEPYVKAKYRRSWELTDSTLVQLRPIVYWKSDEGLGSTLHTDLDHLLSEKYMLRWSTSTNISQDNEIEGVAWSNWFSLFQALANRKAVSYHTFVLGETDADVPVQNYGIEVRYRRRIAREWLFIEFVTNLSWPREFLEEHRESNIGVGAGFEMYFGPVPEGKMR